MTARAEAVPCGVHDLGLEGACRGCPETVRDGLACASTEALLAELDTRAAAEPMPEPIDSPERARVALADLTGKRREYFVALLLDACHRLIKREVISIGTLTASLVHPREVFFPAIKAGAAALIVAHNHPSGDPQPSREDRETTRRLTEAGRILGLPILDHVIIARRGYFSFRERGLLDA